MPLVETLISTGLVASGALVGQGVLAPILAGIVDNALVIGFGLFIVGAFLASRTEGFLKNIAGGVALAGVFVLVTPIVSPLIASVAGR